MISILRAAVATSIQDRGRYGHLAEGITISGAMDVASLDATNALAGAMPGSAGIEFGPGPLRIEVHQGGTIAFGGAPRRGAPWWQTLAVRPGQTFELSSPQSGVWSYLCVEGGVSAPLHMGSRSTTVREGIGSWLTAGSPVLAGHERAEPSVPQPPPMRGEIRMFGELLGAFIVGEKVDRMGYMLRGGSFAPYEAVDRSEPLLPGCVQVTPSGDAIALMAEAPTVGGYRVEGVIHSADLRLLAQTPALHPIYFRNLSWMG
ncbi:MAG TPA: biotin-dependent carboxyltransferase family protein [Actinomycetota bacterium]|nr:biotin-dependent carboxyltransferase family protein [Actinomycetota bacterium]